MEGMVKNGLFWCLAILLSLSLIHPATARLHTSSPLLSPAASREPQHQNAYATMLYAGTPKDYEFFVATRVMLRVLMTHEPDADVVILCSKDVPHQWVQNFVEDGVRVLLVDNVPNPYMGQPGANQRFRHTLNKLLAWGLTEYKRVVMLDADNLFLRNTDELFQCGEFCAVFINPCVFHTGLFVLEPKNETLSDMLEKLQTLPSRDGADQGFLTSYYTGLLEAPLFRPPEDGTVLEGRYRLPFGYQMDAGYYYLSGKFHVPCSAKSVMTFPSVSMMKPWYWWSWPALPLGLYWHEQRRLTIGYSHEMPVLLTLVAVWFVVLVISICIRRRTSAIVSSLANGSPSALSALKPCLAARSICPSQEALGLPLKLASMLWNPTLLKGAALGGIVWSFLIPLYFIPLTVHPLIGWALYFEGLLALLAALLAAIPALPVSPVLAIFCIGLGGWAGLAAPIYKHALQKVASVWIMSAAASPVLLWAVKGICNAANMAQGNMLEREPLMARRAGSGMGDVQIDLVKLF